MEVKVNRRPRQKKTKIPKAGTMSKEMKEFFSQDWVPVEDILYGMIKMKPWAGGGYIKIVEVNPINFLLLSPDERADIITNFYQWLKIAPAHLQFHMTTSKTNVDGLISSILKRTADETDPIVLKRRDAYIEKIKNLSASDSLSKHFYISYRYEGGDDGISDDIKEIAETMYQTQGYIRYYLGKSGNSLIEYDDDNMFLAELIYDELNPNSCRTEPFEQRVSRVATDYQSYMYSSNREFVLDEIPIQDYLATRGIINKSSKYIIRDGIFETHLYIKSDGYRHSVFSAWMEEFTNFGDGVSVNIYATKLNRQKMIDAAGRTTRIKSSEARDSNVREDDQDMYMSSAANSKFVQQQLRDENEDLYDVAIMLTIRAVTLKKLMSQKNNIKRLLRSKDYFVEETRNYNEEATYMSFPLLMVNKHIFQKAKRNMLTSSLASTYFFTAFELYDNDGILLGLNGVNSSLAVPNPFNSKIYKNGNMAITGTSGMGKTYLLQQLGYALRVSGVRVYYILPYKGHEYYKACKEINGEFITLAPGAKTCINIMAIRPQAEVDTSLVEDDGYLQESALSKKVHQIITFVQLLKPKEEMTDMEETQLNIILTQLYERFGITDDNDSIWLNKEERLLKPMPIIGDLYDDCMNDEILHDRVAVALRPFVEGTCKNMNGQTNVNLDNKYIIFDVSNAGKQFLPAFSFIAVDCSYDGVKADRTELCAMIMDEVWKMMVNIYCAEFVMEIYKIIRGYGGLAISATQDISDFLSFQGGVYGKKVISTSKIKFVLGAEKEELESLKNTVGLTDEEVKQLIKYDRGQALMVSNGEKIPIFVKGTDEETEIFTTDPATLRRIKERKEAERQQKQAS